VHTGIENGELFIRLRGPWLHVILFEVPMLAIVSEVRNRYRAKSNWNRRASSCIASSTG
jgi:nicotinic acid phosphoribosyltransferase